MMRALAPGKLLSNVIEDGNEILFSIVTFEYRVRILLALFVSQFLSGLAIHPFQASLGLWENLLALCIMWHRAHKRDPTMAEL